MVNEQRFRADLYYRLNVFPITIPPLRERREDIPTLVRYFVQEFATRMRKEIESIPSESMDALVNYAWPGNLRELRNVLERSVILTSGKRLHVPKDALGETTGIIGTGGVHGGCRASPYYGRAGGDARGGRRTGGSGGIAGVEAQHFAVANAESSVLVEPIFRHVLVYRR